MRARNVCCVHISLSHQKEARIEKAPEAERAQGQGGEVLAVAVWQFWKKSCHCTEIQSKKTTPIGPLK